ncbi:MFS transporter [Kiloniella sp. b19]|uniref:MFS transporter n=1 Tax=Kiloniella sp. GXU_MW_B19 TaxID=3141326 RepID=UPI0031E2090A
MLNAIRDTWAILLGVAFMMLGNGLQGSALGLRADLAGLDTFVTGIVMTGYFMGYFIGSLTTPNLLAKVGHVRVFAAFASLASVANLLFPIYTDPVFWFFARVITGISFSALYIVVESWLNESSTNENRGQILSIYMILSYGGLSLSQLLLNVGPVEDYILFVIMSVLVSLALVPTSLTATRVPNFEAPSPVSIVRLWRISPLGLTASLNSGLSISAILGVGAVYANQVGMKTSDVALFILLMNMGGLVFQYPIGKLSDTMDRRQVTVVLFFASAILAFACHKLASADATLWFLGAAFVFGGTALPIYSLSIAHTNDHLDSSEIVNATAALIKVNAVGTILGPLLVSGAMSYLGTEAYFPFMITIMLLTGVFGLYRMTRRAAVPLEDQGDFVAVPAKGTAMVATLTPEAEEWLEEQEASVSVSDSEILTDAEELLDDGPALFEEETDDNKPDKDF